jgi:SAM-dependent methyltransferase
VCGTPGRQTSISVTTDLTYRVCKCHECGLAFTSPRPSPEALEEFYSEKYFNSADPRLGYADYDGDSLAALNAGRTWDDLAAWAPQTRSLRTRTLLDVGAATGSFGARAAADGWRVTACELSDSARAKAAAKGLCTVRSMEDAQGPFGLITMFHVLEHLIDPVDGLEQARTLVAPDGLLAVELPQWRSAGRLARRSKWAQLKPPEHINFFTKSSLREALHRSGWEVVQSSTPYPHAAERAWGAAKSRELRTAAIQAARFAVGAAGLGGYLRCIARPT